MTVSGVSVRLNPAGIAAVVKQASAHLIPKLTIQVETAAKRLCPVDTGRLRASITHDLLDDGGGMVGVVYSDVTYAPFVEFGTRNMAAQPYLRPALASIAGGVGVNDLSAGTGGVA